MTFIFPKPIRLPWRVRARAWCRMAWAVLRARIRNLRVEIQQRRPRRSTLESALGVTPATGVLLVTGHWAIWFRAHDDHRAFSIGKTRGSYLEAMEAAQLAVACVKDSNGPMVGEFWVEPIPGLET